MASDLTPIKISLAGVKHPLRKFQKDNDFRTEWARAFRNAWHNARVAEIRADVSDNPYLYLWVDKDEREGNGRFDARVFTDLGDPVNNTRLIRLRNIRLHPSAKDGDYPRMVIQCRYATAEGFTGYINTDGQDARTYWDEVAQTKNAEGYLASMHFTGGGSPSTSQERFILKALSALGLSVRIAYASDKHPWNFSFWDYQQRAMRDPADAAGLYRTFIYRGDTWLGKLRSFEENFDGISPTAFTSIPAGNSRILGVFGVDDSVDGQLLRLTHKFKRWPSSGNVSFQEGMVISAITRQDTNAGPMFCLADKAGEIGLFCIPDVMTLERRHRIEAGDISSFYRLLLCFGRYVGLRAPQNSTGCASVVKLVETGRGRFEQQVLIDGLPGLMQPREFHSDVPRLLLDGPHGMKFSNEIPEVGLWYPEQTLLGVPDEGVVEDFDMTILN